MCMNRLLALLLSLTSFVSAAEVADVVTTDAAVPEDLRAQMSELGLCKDEPELRDSRWIRRCDAWLHKALWADAAGSK